MVSLSERSKIVYLVIAISLIIAASALAYRTVLSLIETRSWVDHTQTILATTDRFFLTMKDLESSARAFVITGHENEVSSYLRTTFAAPEVMAELRSLTADNASQQRRLDSLEPLVKNKLSTMEAMIKARKDSGVGSESIRELLRRSVTLMDEIKALIEAMADEEKQLYQTRQQAAASDANQILLVIAGAIGASIFIVCIMFYVAYNEARRRRAVHTQLQTLNAELEERVNERTEELSRSVAALQEEGAVRKTSEEDLQRTRVFLDLVVENIPAMLFVKDAKDFRFVLFNRAGEQLLGFDRKDLIGKNDYDLFPKEQADFFIARDKGVLQSGKLQLIPEETITTRHNGVRVFQTMKMPVPDEHGQPKYILGLSEDITERKLLEQAQREAKDTLSAVIDACPVAIICVSLDRTVLVWSRAAEQIFGFTSDEAVGRPYELVPPGYQDEFDRLFERALAGETLRDIRVQRSRKDGSLIDVSFDGAAMFDSGGVRGVAYALTDITQRKSVEMQLRQAQKMEAVGNLTGGLAHDFNNLLSIIIGNLDLMRERQNVDVESDELAREALDAALRGAELTRRLLAFARRQPLQPDRIDVNDLTAGIGKLLSRTLGDDIEITFGQSDQVWPVLADPAQLEASLLNIVNNARDAMPKGGKLVISTRNRTLDKDYAALHTGLVPGDYAMIEVSDNGSGIPPEVASQIFEPFFTTKEQSKGTGLGLSMVFGFMKQSGGHINVYSEVGVGTTFRLYLPRAFASEETAEKSSEVTIVLGGPETVLVVEDNASLRRVVARQLKELGYKFLEAEDGPTALKILESETVDLLFTDIVMPGGMSGYDLARTALVRWPAMKALLTSGFPEAKLNGNGAPPVNIRLLIKPYRKEDLARMLREVLDK